jgi:hypothetical protein
MDYIIYAIAGACAALVVSLILSMCGVIEEHRPMEGNVYKCNCANDYQDRRYGKNMRVFTIGNSKRTCTVCGKSVDDASVRNPASVKK